MKAVVLRSFGSADNFVEADLPIPDLRRGEVRIKLKAASFNPVDCQIRKGQPESTHVRSMILGRDLSGVVDAVHEDVSDFKIGDEVFSYVCNLASSGTYAEYVCVPAELVARKPAALTFEQAAAVPVAGITACLALSKTQTGASKSVFIAGGAGGVGTFAVMLARQLRVRSLVATAGNAKSRAHLIENCGLRDEQVLNYKDDDLVAQALRRSDGGFDAVLDLVGGRMLSVCCTLLAVDGHLASATEAPKHDDFEVLFEKNASFHSVGAHAYSLRSNRNAWLAYRRSLDHLGGLFDSGALAAPATRTLGALSPEVVRQAHLLLDANAVQGKLVMSF